MTANDKSAVIPYIGTYAYGNNMGWYGNHLSDQNVAQLAYNSGARTIRPSLESELIDGYGVDVRKDAFAYYKQIGLIDLTAFLGKPHSSVREAATFPNCPERAKTFKGMYENIWLDTNKTQINTANTLANYIYKTVNSQSYRNVKFWEIINEPDLTYGAGGWDPNNSTYGWNKVNPLPKDLPNLYAPIFYYNRMLRVAYDVIKTLRPDAYVCTGGLGYPAFLDSICRNTDNPGAGDPSGKGSGTAGSVTSNFPLLGGAYFDVLSYHEYPSLGEWNVWNNTTNQFDKFHHSDGAIKCLVDKHNGFNTTLAKFKYDGVTYPKKLWLNTETDVNRVTTKDPSGNQAYGSIELQNNFTIKMHVIAQKLGISQFFKYGMGDGADASGVFNVMGVYGNLTPPTTTVANAPKNENFKATSTLANLLYTKPFDTAETTKLALPSNIEGAAFKNSDGTFTYVLWAKTITNESESVTATYTFPFSITGKRAEWDSSSTGATTNFTNVVTLTGAPAFFIAAKPVPNYTVTASSTNGVITKSPEASVYAENTMITLTAVPNQGYRFKSWGGDVTGTTSPVQLLINSNKNVTAIFEPIVTLVSTIKLYSNGTYTQE